MRHLFSNLIIQRNTLNTFVDTRPALLSRILVLSGARLSIVSLTTCAGPKTMLESLEGSFGCAIDVSIENLLKLYLAKLLFITLPCVFVLS